MGLSLKNFNAIKASFNTTINMLGVPAVWSQAKAPEATANITVGFKTAGKDDEEIVNAYGMGAKIITLIDGTTSPAPLKFDRIEIDNEVYTLGAVMPIHLNGTVIGHKAIARGE